MFLARKFRRSTIRLRLAALVVFSGGTALVLVGAVLLGYQRIELRRETTREVSMQAAIVAENVAAALSFSDERAACELLKSLGRDSKLVRAAVFDQSGRLFADYSRSRPWDVQVTQRLLPKRPFREEAHFKDGTLRVSQPVVLGNQTLGVVCLEAGLGEVESRLRRYSANVCLALLASLGAALLMGARMQRGITEPLAELARIAGLVSKEKDYSVRVPVQAIGEIGSLIDAFNDMLARIEVHETARKQAEQSLRESEERFALAARGANDGLWDWKKSTNLTYLSPRGNQMLGYAEAERWWTQEEWAAIVHPSDRARVLEEWDRCTRDRRDDFVTEYRVRHRDNSSMWILSRGRAVKDESGHVVRVAGSLTDVTEGKVADQLTGLRSRFYFVDRLDNAIEDSAVGSAPFAVLFLDLDRFKLVNDSLGHAAGDELLMEIARRLRLAFADSAYPNVIARLGGDEFAVLLRNAGRKEAVDCAERILLTLSVPLQLGSQQVYPGVSIGVALDTTARKPEELLRNADTAMYHAKKCGRGRVEVFDETMRDRVRARLEIESELRTAIETGQLVLYYQPQLSINGNYLNGFEALVRWEHPERGLVNPCEFISVAEDTGLILPLGRWVLREGCRQMAAWQKQFGQRSELTLSINVSYQQIRDSNFVDDVRRAIEETGLRPGTLRLEMTESTIMANPDQTSEILARLKKLDVGLEIDDFGTGYSSLSCLSRLPFDTVKIDRSFVRDLGTKSEGSEIVRAILDLARSMTMTVIAEGVETRRQLRELKAMGCKYVQGYYFSEPVKSEAAARMFERETPHSFPEQPLKISAGEIYAHS